MSMERLTRRDEVGTVIEPRNRMEAWRMAKLLADYEDTWLEPEAVAQLKQIADIFNCDPGDPAQLKGLLDKLRGWHESERDGRLVVLPPDKVRWIKAILTERARQDQMWGDHSRNHPFEWMSILGEEYGELCEAVNETCFLTATHPERGGYEKIIREATQVAAVALAILEQADVAHRVTAQVAMALGRKEEAKT